MDGTALLSGLTPDQAAAVTSSAEPLCILAGAGSGKTRVLTRRIAHRVATGTADPRHVLALTFTRKAGGELVRRLHGLGVRDDVVAGTFHAVAYAQLRRRWADLSQPPPSLLERKVRLIARLLGRRRRDATVQPADIAAEIEWAKARMVSPAGYEREATRAGRRSPLPAAAMASLFEHYEEEKRRRGLVDFDDLLLLCAHALATDTGFAARQRWQFRHLFVDEFQDLNPVQFGLLTGWLGDRTDLCVVGDPNQAIYGWNGADASYLSSFADHFPTAETVHLRDSFRSTPQILGVAHAVLLAGDRRAVPLVPHRPPGRVPAVRSFPTDLAEARAVARALRSRHASGRRWSDMAVLARTNAQLAILEEALRAASIPCRLRGAAAFLDRPEIQEALGELVRGPGLLATRIADLDEIVGEAPDDEAGAAADRRAALAELVRLGRDFLTLDPDGTPEAFHAWLAASLRGDDGPDGDVVELASFHASKGLEWPVVVVTGLEQGLVPISHARTDDAVDEERRLLYVAVTRAQDDLACTWARSRRFGSRDVPRQPSPWLDDIEAACKLLAEQGSTSPDWATHLAAARRAVRAANGGAKLGADADPGVLAALKRWRKATARATGVPAYVIAHDATLAAVAEARPRSRRSLLAVPGFGPVKADRYGDAILRIIAEAAEPESA